MLTHHGGTEQNGSSHLSSLLGNVTLLERPFHPVTGLIDLGVTSANRAAALTHRLLVFSPRQSLDPKPVEINQLVNSMGELLQRSINESIDLDMRLVGPLWTAEADPNQLEGALLNLVLNARDAMPGGGRLTVETCNRHLDSVFTATYGTLQPGDYVELSVSDTGCGIPDSVIGRLSSRPSLSARANGADCGGRPAVRVLVSAVPKELDYGFVEGVDAVTAVPIIESEQRIDLMISDVGLPGMNGRQLAEIGRQIRPGVEGAVHHRVCRACGGAWRVS